MWDLRSWPCPTLPLIRILILASCVNHRKYDCSTVNVHNEVVVFWKCGCAKFCTFPCLQVQKSVCDVRAVVFPILSVLRLNKNLYRHQNGTKFKVANCSHWAPHLAPWALPGVQKFCSITQGIWLGPLLSKMNEKDHVFTKNWLLCTLSLVKSPMCSGLLRHQISQIN